MLKIDLQIHEPTLLAALQELLPQAGMCIKENEKEADCLLFTPPSVEGCRPALNFLSLSQPLRFLDLLPLLEGLPYSREITFAHFSLDIREKILKNLNTQESQRLTEKESQLLRFFYQHRGADLSKETLLQEIWAYHPDAETHTLETHIYRLRQKVETDPNNPQIILNGREGYVLKQ
ncbi:MAG: winged helix-turn-helix domain-containing protein [Alphaproteobacteria bacterium]|nr:winged helix-turn-helix domain-containing protein [Alphaproteobacteria bacterium]